MQEKLKFTHHKRLVIVALIGFLIGFYDGIFGPGTGTFLVFFLVSAIGYAFLKASDTNSSDVGDLTQARGTSAGQQARSLS